MVVFARDISATKELERQLLEGEGKRAMADLAGGVEHRLDRIADHRFGGHEFDPVSGAEMERLIAETQIGRAHV